ncbi:hypothetical protein Tco_0136297 [Tanacetum coccineum]
MFLEYKVNTKGIKLCPDKEDVVLSLLSLKCLKVEQKAEWKVGKLDSDFHWTEEVESAFKQMKQLIAKLPALTAPKEKEEIIVYLAAVKEAPRLERSRSELHINGKIGLGTGACKQASEKILPSTPNYSGHRPAHKTSVVKTRSSGKTTKVEYRVGRICHTL